MPAGPRQSTEFTASSETVALEQNSMQYRISQQSLQWRLEFLTDCNTKIRLAKYGNSIYPWEIRGSYWSKDYTLPYFSLSVALIVHRRLAKLVFLMISQRYFIMSDKS